MREHELTNIARNARSILQAPGMTAQTSQYPLAIADIHGHNYAFCSKKSVSHISRIVNNLTEWYPPLAPFW